VLRRTADDDDPAERVIVANADQLVIVSSLTDPPPSTGFIDRCLVAAYDAGIEPLLCLTKSDLVAGPPAILDYYADLELHHVTTRPDQPPDPLRERLTARVSVMVGHSGVGKSTLVNRLVPGAGRAVGKVRSIGKGRHTSTSVVALRLPAGGWIVDTPGVRSFGLAHVSAVSLLHGFPDLDRGTEHCPSDCDHTTTHGECTLDDWVTAGNTDPRRLASYRRLLTSRTTDE
jgi:ribosome biogenesis GTPase